MLLFYTEDLLTFLSSSEERAGSFLKTLLSLYSSQIFFPPCTGFFCLMAAWLNEVVVRAVALLSALTKEYNMHIIQCWSGNCTSQVWTQNMISSLPESAVICIGESNSIQRKSNKCGGNPKIVGVGRRLSESLEQGLVMAPPRARMTNDRSTGVAINVKLAGIGTRRRLLRYRPLAAADYADCAVK